MLACIAYPEMTSQGMPPIFTATDEYSTEFILDTLVGWSERMVPPLKLPEFGLTSIPV